MIVNLCPHPDGFELVTARDGMNELLMQHAECAVCGEMRPAEEARIVKEAGQGKVMIRPAVGGNQEGQHI